MKIKFDCGTKLDTAIHLAIHNAKVLDEHVDFEFNGVNFHITPNTTFDHAKKFFKQAMRELSSLG